MVAAIRDAEWYVQSYSVNFVLTEVFGVAIEHPKSGRDFVRMYFLGKRRELVSPVYGPGSPVSPTYPPS